MRRLAWVALGAVVGFAAGAVWAWKLLLDEKRRTVTTTREGE